MKLSELEERARQEQEERQLLAAEEQLEKQIAESKAAEEFRQEVITWMFQEANLDSDELKAVLSVVDKKYRRVKLSLPEHTSIIFQLISTDEGFAVRDGRFEVERYDNYARQVQGLDNALLAAAEEWRKRVEEEAKEAEREAKRQAERELRDQYAAERGAKYLDLLNGHPILQPILDLLGAFLEERDQFAEDLAMAEEFAAGVEARYEERLERAQYEVAHLESERSRLQNDLWDEQEKLRRAERECGR